MGNSKVATVEPYSENIHRKVAKQGNTSEHKQISRHVTSSQRSQDRAAYSVLLLGVASNFIRYIISNFNHNITVVGRVA
jgi:hypothetical protein